MQSTITPVGFIQRMNFYLGRNWLRVKYVIRISQTSWKGTVLFLVYALRCACIKNKTVINMPAYAVISGHNSCVVNTWDEAKTRCQGVPKTYCKKFNTEEEAQDYISSVTGNKNIENRKVPDYKPATEIDNNATKDNELNLLKSFSSKVDTAKSEINNLTAFIMENKAHFGSTKITKKFQTFSNTVGESLDKLYNRVIKYKQNNIYDAESDSSFDSDSPNYLLTILLFTLTQKITKKFQTFSNTVGESLDKLYNRVIKYKQNNIYDAESDSSFDSDSPKNKRRKNATLNTNKSYTAGNQVPESTSIMETNDLSICIKENNSVTDTPDSNKQNELQYAQDGYLVVYVDGSCLSNGCSKARAGIGVWFGPNNTLNVAEPVYGKPTNNNAEIQAATVAIEQARSVGAKKLRIFSDSMFMINCITQWLPKWKKNNWTTSGGEPVKNKEQLLKLDAAVNTMNSIDWKYVKGHANSVGNNMADELARIGAAKYGNSKK